MALSARQYRILDAMGIDVWMPRSQPQPARPAGPQTKSARNVPQAASEQSLAPPAQSKQTMPSVPTREQGPAVSCRALSLRSGCHHALVDDSIHQERAFWLDLLRSSHGFNAEASVREGRFDWPIPSLLHADATAAQKALLGYVQADTLIWIRGDALANLLMGAGTWQSFPARHTIGQAEVWVLGSDMDLKAADTRRALWAALDDLS